MKNFLNTPKKKIAAVAVGAVLLVGIFLLATASAGASNTTRGIGLEKSIAVALADAGLKQEQVMGLQGHFDKENGIDSYEVSFHANGYEYDYVIKAADGAILESQIEAPDGHSVTADEALDIGLNKALEAALNHADVKKNDVEITQSKKDRDDGAPVYEFKFYDKNAEYEYEIDAVTGAVRSFSREAIRQVPSANDVSGSSGNADSSGNAGSDYIGADKAKSIALSHAGVNTSAASFTRAKLDRDDGRTLYEIDFYTADREYDYEIDALTGKILDYDSEPLDDWDDDDDWDDAWDD